MTDLIDARRHGTTHTYRMGCRCDDCTEAKRDQVRRYRAGVDDRMLTGNVKHGTTAVYARGCRCGDCSEAGRDERLRSRFNITAEQYDAMYEAQSGVCAICQQSATKLAVDHDHACCPGKRSCGQCVRGLLCARCNTALVYLRDDPAAAMAAATYLASKITSALAGREG